MNNIILIGMPGSGKSTVGRRLASEFSLSFIDTDDVIVEKFGMPLWQIIELYGVYRFMEIENEVICQFSCENCVVATGGSVVLYPKAMEHLAELGKLVYLKTELSQLKLRIKNMATRGIVFKPSQTLDDVYAERVPLYEKYAQITVDEGSKSLGKCVQTLINNIQS